MSYTVGTDLGRLRELIGDTSVEDELFGDEFLNALLADYSIGKSAIVALQRLVNDPRLLIRHFRGLGALGIGDLASLQRSVREQIEWIEKSALAPVAEPSTDARFPESDLTDVGRSTDEDGLWTPSTVDDYLLELEQRT